MRKLLPFVFAVLIGTIVATAWANFSPAPSTNAPSATAAASMNPLEMMRNAIGLPAQQHYDAH